MNIAVIGTGRIGGTLGQRWHAAGHQVAYGSRKGSGTGPGGGPVLPVGEAITGAEVVLLAVPGGAVAEVVAAHGAALAGKVVIDAVNRIGEPVVNSHAAITAVGLEPLFAGDAGASATVDALLPLWFALVRDNGGNRRIALRVTR